MPVNESDAAWITRVLDVTGTLSATRKLLGHASIQVPADAHADWGHRPVGGHDAGSPEGQG